MLGLFMMITVYVCWMILEAVYDRKEQREWAKEAPRYRHKQIMKLEAELGLPITGGSYYHVEEMK